MGTITWTNLDFSSKVFCGIHTGAISQKMFKMSVLDMDLKIINFHNYSLITEGPMS